MLYTFYVKTKRNAVCGNLICIVKHQFKLIENIHILLQSSVNFLCCSSLSSFLPVPHETRRTGKLMEGRNGPHLREIFQKLKNIVEMMKEMSGSGAVHFWTRGNLCYSLTCSLQNQESCFSLNQHVLAVTMTMLT